MNRPQPTITVIIAVRNGAATLQRAFDSIFEQTYGNRDLIVIDGASTDGTAKIIERNATRIAYWESKPDRGVYHAWNKALTYATGDWICFLGADDTLDDPDVLVRVANVLGGANRRFRVVYGQLNVVDHLRAEMRTMGEAWDRDAFRNDMTIPHPATFHHRTLFARNGRFDERFQIAGDYEFLLRELLHHDALFVPDVVVNMGAGGLSERPSSTYRLLREIHRARHMHGLESAPEWRSGRLIRALCRIWITRTFGPRTADVVAGAYRFVARRPAPPR